MVVKEDGTKWACQSCLKGHRVSGCNHTERELIAVPKKGRPVTQCQHCRQERKKRSAHVSCDCGDSGKHHHPREKCIHLREAEDRSRGDRLDEQSSDSDPAYLTAIAEEQGCCCGHGGRCTCSVRMRELDDSARPRGPAVKPRPSKTVSEGSLTTFMNGRHRPVHRKNHAAHEHGMPYRVPAPRSSIESEVDQAARHSAENLPNINHAPYSPSWGTPYNGGRRRSKSEQPRTHPDQNGYTASFNLYHTPPPANFTPPPTDFPPLTPMSTNGSAQSVASDNNEFPAFDPTTGVEIPYNPWDMLPIDTNSATAFDPLTAWSAGSGDTVATSQPGLTTASSVPHSETDEVPSIENLYSTGPVYTQTQSIGYSPGTSNASSPQPSDSPYFDRRSLPPGFMGTSDFVHSGVSNEWQTAVANAAAVNQGKVQPTASPLGAEGTWSQLNRSPMTSSPVSYNDSPMMSRPQSRSLGPCSAPSQDLLRDLFPEMYLDHIQQPYLPTRKTFSGASASMPTSAPINFGEQSDANYGITSQPWTGVSMMTAMPESYHYDSDPGYSSQPLTPEWSQ